MKTNLDKFREVENPALSYLGVDWSRMTGNIPVDTIKVMTSLFSSMLTIIRTTTKNRLVTVLVAKLLYNYECPSVCQV